MGEMGKVLLACAGEGAGKELCLMGLCLSWAAFTPWPGSAREDLLFFLPAAFSCLVHWSLPRLKEQRNGEGCPAALPVSACASPITRVGWCLLSRPGWQAVPGD